MTEAGNLTRGSRSQAKFPRQWLSDHGPRARSRRVIRVKGESTEPTLPNGCLVLVDLASDERKQHGIFAIRTGDELIVKRLALDQKLGWLPESDLGPTTRQSSARSGGWGAACRRRRTMAYAAARSRPLQRGGAGVGSETENQVAQGRPSGMSHAQKDQNTPTVANLSRVSVVTAGKASRTRRQRNRTVLNSEMGLFGCPL